MQTTAETATPVSLIRSRIGSHLNGLYVVRRSPTTGEPYESFGLLALVDMTREEAYDLLGPLSAELIDHFGWSLNLDIEPGTAETVDLAPDEMMAI